MTAAETRALAIGSHVFCTVHAVSGWYRLTAIRPHDGYIKIDGFSTWNPPHNFALTDERGRAYPDVFGARDRGLAAISASTQARPCGECGGSGVLTRLGGDWGKTAETTVSCWCCCGTGTLSRKAGDS